ncbi:MAG: magnesium chelatase domain-containing protein, partial [Candidatus Puniceispirillaceae bacterium]
MKSLIHTVSFKGIETVTVSVQVHISNGLPAMAIVGLADKAVAESKERVRAALSSLGLSLPAKRIPVNLAPADLVKEAAHFDLPIALRLMTAMGVLPADSVDEYLVLGELSLDGSIQPVIGTLPAALNAAAQKRRIICPSANGPEAGWAGELDVVAA